MNPIEQARYDRVFDAYSRGADHLTRESFTEFANILARVRGLAPDDPAVAAYQQSQSEVWDGLAALADTDHDGRVSREEFQGAGAEISKAFKQAQESGDAMPFQSWVALLFGVIDADGDGRVTQAEYADWLEALNLLQDTDLDTAFAGFDKNDDGYLSLEEFRSIYVDYWTIFDPNIAAHRWLGP